MSYTKTDAAIDTCAEIARTLRSTDTADMTQTELVMLLEEIYEQLDYVESGFDENGYLREE